MPEKQTTNEATAEHCDPCIAVGGIIDNWPCPSTHHDPATQELARALALEFNSDDGTVSDEQIGWFIEDAEQIIDRVSPPFKVRKISMDDPIKFAVNGVFCEWQDGDKDGGALTVYGGR